MKNLLTLNQITAQLHALDKRGTADALEIGALLIEAKERLVAENEQSFTDWLNHEFAWSHRTADRFMRARKWYEGQAADARHCVDSGLTITALYVVSAEAAPLSAQEEIVKLAKCQRVGGTAARKIIADMREPDDCSDEPEAAPSDEANAALANAVETILTCDPQAQGLEGLEGPSLVRAAEILSQLARRARGDDAVKIAADRAEARSATAKAQLAKSFVPSPKVEDLQVGQVLS